MHDCEKFREELTDRVLEGKPVEANECRDCADFYQEALAAVDIVDSFEVRPPELSEEYWVDFNSRLRQRLLSETPQPGTRIRIN